MKWKQGQHVLIVGQTGTGKSFLARELLKLRTGWILGLFSKADPLVWWGFKTVHRAEAVEPSRGKRWKLFPVATKAASLIESQRREFSEALERVWEDGGWTVYVDELYYASDRLKLDEELSALFTQGRSKAITMVAGVQRPVGFLRTAFSEATYVISFRLGDARDRKTLGEATSREWAESLKDLERYQFSILDKSTGEVAVGSARDIETLLGGK